MARLYGPAVRCKPKRAMERQGLALLYPALEWSVFAPGHHVYPRASDLILGEALRGRSCHQITGETARPFLHLLNPTRRLGGYSSPCQLRDGGGSHIGEVTVALGKACEQVAIGCGHSLHRVAAILALRGG